MDAATFLTLVMACAPQVHADTARAPVHIESGFNPWAIGVVGGALERQPRRHSEAVATARALKSAGRNFSVGLGQINVGNFARLGLTIESAFEPCANLTAMQQLLVDCYDRAGATAQSSASQSALRRALSCYYSGNYTTGFLHGYVRRVVGAARNAASTTASASLTPTKESS